MSNCRTMRRIRWAWALVKHKSAGCCCWAGASLRIEIKSNYPIFSSMVCVVCTYFRHHSSVAVVVFCKVNNHYATFDVSSSQDHGDDCDGQSARRSTVLFSNRNTIYLDCGWWLQINQFSAIACSNGWDYSRLRYLFDISVSIDSNKNKGCEKKSHSSECVLCMLLLPSTS